MRAIVFECARGRAVCVCLSGWACGCTRAHTACTRWSTCPSSRRSSSPCSPTPSRTRRAASPRIAIQLVTNHLCVSRVDTLEDKARRQPALHCHSVFSACPQHAGYTSSMRFACRHPRGQGAPRRVLPIGIQWARLRPARCLHGPACSPAQSRIRSGHSAGAVLPASNAQAPPARFVFPWVGARASVASFAPACRAQMTDANSCSHFLRSFCVHCRRGAPRAQKFDACAGAPGAQFTPAMKAAWAWLWIWLTESMLVVEKVPAQTSAGADATNTGG